MKIFFFATILYLNFFNLFVGVRDEINKNIFPFSFMCFFACFINFNEISSPFLPPVVANCDDFGSLGSLGKYGALKVIISNLLFIFEKRFV